MIENSRITNQKINENLNPHTKSIVEINKIRSDLKEKGEILLNSPESPLKKRTEMEFHIELTLRNVQYKILKEGVMNPIESTSGI